MAHSIGIQCCPGQLLQLSKKYDPSTGRKLRHVWYLLRIIDITVICTCTAWYLHVNKRSAIYTTAYTTSIIGCIVFDIDDDRKYIAVYHGALIANIIINTALKLCRQLMLAHEHRINTIQSNVRVVLRERPLGLDLTISYNSLMVNISCHPSWQDDKRLMPLSQSATYC